MSVLLQYLREKLSETLFSGKEWKIRMNAELLAKIEKTTEEEKAILRGQNSINRALYYSSEKSSKKDEIDSARVLSDGRLIDIRRHVRFIHFPKHTHNFVEFMYVCRGSVTNIIDGQTIVLKEGDILLMNQHAEQEILPAGRNDIAVNFMILPEFFDTAFRMLGKEENALRGFIISCLTEKNKGGNYLCFAVSGILPVQNIIENLIYGMTEASPNRRSLNEITMGLLFLNLMNYTDLMQVPENSFEQDLVIRILHYMDTDYKKAALENFSLRSGYDVYTLSRIIRRNTGKTFTELLQERRLQQADFLLRNTDVSVLDIADAVGYANTSFFHRLFKKHFGMSPRSYRIRARQNI